MSKGLTYSASTTLSGVSTISGGYSSIATTTDAVNLSTVNSMPIITSSGYGHIYDYTGHPVEYKVGGYTFELSRKLTQSEVMFLSNITINGYTFYEISMDNNMYIKEDLLDILLPIIKLMKRKETVKKVLKNKEN